MPARIRTDNGAPFAGTRLLGLSKLSLGWMKLGIVHERIQAGRPQQNGRHERMHRTLKEDTTKPPAASLHAQQSRFDNFRYMFNNERPHEGLNNQVPASLYIPSSIRLPHKLPEFTYPKGLLLRRVNNSGDTSWHKNRVFISEVFRFEELAFELITPGFYRVFFRDMEIENSTWMSFALGPHDEWSDLPMNSLACSPQLTPLPGVDVHARSNTVPSSRPTALLRTIEREGKRTGVLGDGLLRNQSPLIASFPQHSGRSGRLWRSQPPPIA